MSITNSNDFNKAQELLDNLSNKTNIKRIKKENGLIERASLDNNKVILVEDNRQIILG